jgi:hypothetical protein
METQHIRDEQRLRDLEQQQEDVRDEEERRRRNPPSNEGNPSGGT